MDTPCLKDVAPYQAGSAGILPAVPRASLRRRLGQALPSDLRARRPRNSRRDGGATDGIPPPLPATQKKLAESPPLPAGSRSTTRTKTHILSTRRPERRPLPA